MLAVVVFVAPLLVRNQRAYGAPFGPPEFVVLHQGVTPGAGKSEEKLRLNLTSAFVQLCEPNSQPPWWRVPVRQMGERVMGTLPTARDSYAFQGLSRSEELKKIYAVVAPDADVTSTGVLLPALGLAATMVAWRRRRTRDGELALVWAVVLTAFVVFLHWRLQWHPYLFRFLVLGTPWLAVLVIWWLQALPRRLGISAGIVTAATTLHGFVAGTTDTYQAGWPATMQPAQSTGFYVYAQIRDWARTLDRPEEPVRPCLQVNAPLAAFYRQQPLRRVLPGKASALQGRTMADIVHPGEGWLIVPVAACMGREGRVMGRTWLFDGDPRHPYSVAAWRALQPGESPVPLLYRNGVVAQEGGLRRELLIRGWDNGAVSLQLRNAGPAAVKFIVASSLGAAAYELAQGARLLLALDVPADGLLPVAIDFPVGGAIEAQLAP
jgi:hypothetical protein